MSEEIILFHFETVKISLLVAVIQVAAYVIKIPTTVKENINQEIIDFFIVFFIKIKIKN